VVVCMFCGPWFKIHVEVFIPFILQCMNSYNIGICIFYEFNGFNMNS
jgi:hypothetical protein